MPPMLPAMLPAMLPLPEASTGFAPLPPTDDARFTPLAADVRTTPPTTIEQAKSKRPERAAEAYAAYESLGSDRSFAKLVEALRQADSDHYKTTSAATLLRQVKRWAQRDGWRERVRAYDQAQEEALRKQAEDAFNEMNRLQAEGSRALWAQAAAQLLALLRLDEATIHRFTKAQELLACGLPLTPQLAAFANPDELKKLLVVSPHIRALVWREGIEVERLARGAATEIAYQQHAGGVRISVMSAAPDGSEPPNPFAVDHNARLRADAAGHANHNDPLIELDELDELEELDDLEE